MIKKSVFEDDLIDGMQQNLQEQYIDEQPADLVKAVDQLNVAAEILEDVGMTAIADDIFGVLVKVAKYSVKRRKKPSLSSSMERLQGTTGLARARRHYESHGDPFSRPKASDGSIPNSIFDDTHEVKDPHTTGLTPDKMVQNLLDHGHPFNKESDGMAVNDTDADELLDLEVKPETLFVDDDVADASDFED